MQGGIRNIIFLGAGASRADKAPLQFELLREYFRLPSKGLRREMDAELKVFFKTFYGIETARVVETTNFPTFEEVLGTLELAMHREENFGVSGETWDQYRIQRCRHHVIALICTILAEKLGVSPSGKANWHTKLVAQLPMNQTTAVISLNYDLLIDNAICYSGRTPEYGTGFANSVPPSGEPLGLYKLHGSLNWLRCPTCGSLTYTGNDKGASYPIERRDRCKTSSCGAETTPIVVPPTFFKVMSDFHLQEIWHRAESALVQAERIFFCGYSLPDADVHIRYLLKRTEVNRGSTPDVFIMNNSKGKTKNTKKEEAGRYKRLFRDPSKVVYTKLTFEEFAVRGLSILNDPIARIAENLSSQ
jgi:hypothetical protein